MAGLYDGAWKFVPPPIVGAITLALRRLGLAEYAGGWVALLLAALIGIEEAMFPAASLVPRHSTVGSTPNRMATSAWSIAGSSRSSARSTTPIPICAAPSPRFPLA